MVSSSKYLKESTGHSQPNEGLDSFFLSESSENTDSKISNKIQYQSNNSTNGWLSPSDVSTTISESSSSSLRSSDIGVQSQKESPGAVISSHIKNASFLGTPSNSSSSCKKKSTKKEANVDVAGLLRDLAAAKQARLVQSDVSQAAFKKPETTRRASRTRQTKTMKSYTEQKKKALVSQLDSIKATLKLLDRLKKLPEQESSHFVFCLIDRDKDGTVDAQELFTALRRKNRNDWASSFNLDRATELITQYDVFGAGYLDRNEFNGCVEAIIVELRMDIKDLAEFLIVQTMNEDPAEVPQSDIIQIQNDSLYIVEDAPDTDPQPVSLKRRTARRQSIGTSSNRRSSLNVASATECTHQANKIKSTKLSRSGVARSFNEEMQGVIETDQCDPQPPSLKRRSVRRQSIGSSSNRPRNLNLPAGTGCTDEFDQIISTKIFDEEPDDRRQGVPPPPLEEGSGYSARFKNIKTIDDDAFFSDRTVTGLFKLLDKQRTHTVDFVVVAPRLYNMAMQMDDSVKTIMRLLLTMEKVDERRLSYEQFARLVLAMVVTAKTTLPDISEELTTYLTMKSVPDQVVADLVPARAFYKETRRSDKNVNSSLSSSWHNMATPPPEALLAPPMGEMTTTSKPDIKSFNKRSNFLRSKSDLSEKSAGRLPPWRRREVHGPSNVTNDTAALSETITGNPILNSKLHQLYDLWGTTGNGQISLPEFSTGLNRFQEAADLDVAVQTEAYFLLFDNGCKQFLDRHEFFRALFAYGQDLELNLYDMIDLMSLTVSHIEPYLCEIHNAYRNSLVNP